MVNLWAVLAAAIAAFVVGAVYYGVLGKQWMAALEWSEAQKSAYAERRKMPVGPMIVAFVALLVMAFMLAGLIAHLSGGAPTVKNGVITGAACWLAFVITTIAVNYAFQQRKPMLTLVDGVHWLLVQVVQGAVIGLVG
jgi:hypothetical protein